MYPYCLSSFNSPPRYPFNMHNFGFTSFSKLPSYAISPISISNARTLTIICPAAVPFASDESMTDHPAAIDDESQHFSFNFRGQRTDSKLVKEDDLVKSQRPGSKVEESHYLGTAEAVNNRRQMVRRSSVMAKQVISIRSALSLGFISQLWVDASSVSWESFTCIICFACSWLLSTSFILILNSNFGIDGSSVMIIFCCWTSLEFYIQICNL